VSEPLPEIVPEFKNYDPETGVGDPSTPLSAALLNTWKDSVQVRTQEAVDRAEAAAGVAEQSTDELVAGVVANSGSDTRASLDEYTETVVTPGVIEQLGASVVKRIDDRASVLSWSALPVSGSPRSGNINPGSASVAVSPPGAYEAFPGLCLCPDGSLLATWRSASAHGWAPGSTTKAARSYDLGQTWSAPWTIYTNPAQDIGYGMLTTLSDGRIACIGQYRSAAPATGSLCVIMFSHDNGLNWGPSAVVPFTFTDYSYAAGNVIELLDGSLLAIGYGKNTADTFSSTRTLRSLDGGVTWQDERVVANGPGTSNNFNEATIGRLPNGQIMALIRSEDTPRKIWRSVSTDEGLSWSTATALFEGWGRPAWARLSSGGVVMTYRGNTDLSHLYRTSWDNGVTWTSPRQLDGPSPRQSVYTQLEELAPGLVAVIYADDTPALANVRFKYLMDGTGLSPLGDLSNDTGYSTLGITAGSGWSLAAASGYTALSWRVKNGYSNINGIGSKASWAANEVIGIVPQALWPDRIIWQGNARIDTTGNVRAVAAGTGNIVVSLMYPLP
jgi:hypothetical protein